MNRIQYFGKKIARITAAIIGSFFVPIIIFCILLIFLGAGFITFSWLENNIFIPDDKEMVMLSEKASPKIPQLQNLQKQYPEVFWHLNTNGIQALSHTLGKPKPSIESEGLGEYLTNIGFENIYIFPNNPCFILEPKAFQMWPQYKKTLLFCSEEPFSFCGQKENSPLDAYHHNPFPFTETAKQLATGKKRYIPISKSWFICLEALDSAP